MIRILKVLHFHSLPLEARVDVAGDVDEAVDREPQEEAEVAANVGHEAARRVQVVVRELLRGGRQRRQFNKRATDERRRPNLTSDLKLVSSITMMSVCILSIWSL